MGNPEQTKSLERMDDFFNNRAEIYDNHMLLEMKLDVFYEEIANLIQPVRPDFRLLDLGCGTGLELIRLFEKYPDMRVTGIDLSIEMLKKLRLRFPGKSVDLICGSYFDVNFGCGFDIVLSTYSLHHFSEDAKRGLYRKIHGALNLGGIFLFGDYIVFSEKYQDKLIAENTRLRQENGILDGEFYHFDIPFAIKNEIKLMKEAGFNFAGAVRQWKNVGVIVASDGIHEL